VEWTKVVASRANLTREIRETKVLREARISTLEQDHNARAAQKGARKKVKKIKKVKNLKEVARRVKAVRVARAEAKVPVDRKAEKSRS
jgi:DNA-binding transcriptional regulator GbsR (MarR family)